MCVFVCVCSVYVCSVSTVRVHTGSILQQCVERSVPGGDSVSTWCVLMKDDQERTIHVKCPEDCVTYDKTPDTEDYHQPYAGNHPPQHIPHSTVCVLRSARAVCWDRD